jgi:hypothetical protein
MNELRQSKEQVALWDTLTLAWILSNPGHTLEPNHASAFLSKDPHSLLDSLLAIRGYDLPELYVPHYVKPPSCSDTIESIPWAKIPSSWSKSQACVLWNTVTNALDAKNWEKAFRLTMPLLRKDCDAVASMLCALHMPAMANLLESTVFLPLAERVLAHAMASHGTHSSRNRCLCETVGNGRTFHISPEALRVWHVVPRPIEDILGNPMRFLKNDTSLYWKEIFATNLHTIEELYSEHFPNDIPDEWSIEECRKSHGIEVDPHTNLPNPWVPAFLVMLDSA